MIKAPQLFLDYEASFHHFPHNLLAESLEEASQHDFPDFSKPSNVSVQRQAFASWFLVLFVLHSDDQAPGP